MKQPTNSIKLFLCLFSGEDCSVIRKSSRGIRVTFAAVGIFVIFIFICCFISAYDFSYSLFQGNRFVCIPIGLIWALLVTNMYLLLLYTVSPAMLPVKNKNKQDSFFTLSMFCRIVFMSLLAIIIAQPLNVLALSSSIENSLQKHVLKERTKMIIVADSLLIKKEIELFQDFNRQIKSRSSNNEMAITNQNLSIIAAKADADKYFISKSTATLKKVQQLDDKVWLNKKEQAIFDLMLNNLSQLVDTAINSDKQFITDLENVALSQVKFQHDFNLYKSNLQKAINAKIDNYDNLDRLLSQSNFYVKRIQLILYERPLSWFITTCACLTFLLPIYFKYKVRDKSDFYSNKLDIEKQIINDEYKAFKKRYSKLLQDNISKYNIRSLTELNDQLLRLKIVSKEKHEQYKQQIAEEYKEEIISKYVYWADDPFRTIPKFNPLNLGKEEDFLKLIYPEQA